MNRTLGRREFMDKAASSALVPFMMNIGSEAERGQEKSSTVPAKGSTPRIQVLIITGRDHFHHRWRAASARLREILEEKPYFEVRITEAFEGATRATLDGYDLVVLNYFGALSPAAEERRWGKQSEQALYDFVRDGGGLVVSHGAFWMGSSWGSEGEEVKRLFGGVMRSTSRRAPGEHTDVRITQPDHPITRGLTRAFISPIDDKYVNLSVPEDNNIDILAETTDPAESYLNGAYYAINGMPGPKIYDIAEARKIPGVDKPQPVMWTKRYGKGRVFAICFGHVGASTLQDAHLTRKTGREVGPTTDVATRMPHFKTLLTRGAEWAATGKVTEDAPVSPDVLAD
jgi:uncharacterized protein